MTLQSQDPDVFGTLEQDVTHSATILAQFGQFVPQLAIQNYQFPHWPVQACLGLLPTLF